MKDLFAAAAERDEAIARVARHVGEDWTSAARRAVVDLSLARESFITDDVWDLLAERGEDAPHDPRAIGAVMRALAREGLIERVPGVYRPSRRRHCTPQLVWRLGPPTPRPGGPR